VLAGLAAARGVVRLVELSLPVVEAGLYDAPAGTALVLANFTYRPIEGLTVRVPLAKPVWAVRSVEQGPRRFTEERAFRRFGCRATARSPCSGLVWGSTTLSCSNDRPRPTICASEFCL
jgi:hypothetical protein